MARLVELKTNNLLESESNHKVKVHGLKERKKASLGSEEPQVKPKFDKKGKIRGLGDDEKYAACSNNKDCPKMSICKNGRCIPFMPALPNEKTGGPTSNPTIAPTKTIAPPQTSTPEAWRVDAGGCLQCTGNFNPTNCPFPTEQACQSSLSSGTGPTQQSYRIDAGGCLPCPSTATSAQCPYTDPNCTVMVNENYFSARSVALLYEDEYDDEYGDIDTFEDDYDYYPDSETPIDSLEESIRRRLNESDMCDGAADGAYCATDNINDGKCLNGKCVSIFDGNVINTGGGETDGKTKGGTRKTYKQSKRKAAGVNRELTSESQYWKKPTIYGSIDRRQAERIDEQWSGVVGEPCCPVHPKPNTTGWFAMNHFDNQGNACVGGCGDQKEPMGIDHMEEEHRRDHEGHRIEKKNYKGQRNNHDDKSGGMIHYKPHPHWCCEWDLIVGCFAKGDEVVMSDGTMKAIDLIEIGDEVKTGRDGGTGIVSETLVHPVNDITQVVNINGITAEPYHPVLVDNKWIPIKELGNISNKFIGDWYNLKIESNTDTNFIIGDVVVSGLGNDCQRLLKDSDKRENQLVNEVR